MNTTHISAKILARDTFKDKGTLERHTSKFFEVIIINKEKFGCGR